MLDRRCSSLCLRQPVAAFGSCLRQRMRTFRSLRQHVPSSFAPCGSVEPPFVSSSSASHAPPRHAGPFLFLRIVSGCRPRSAAVPPVIIVPVLPTGRAVLTRPSSEFHSCTPTPFLRFPHPAAAEHQRSGRHDARLLPTLASRSSQRGLPRAPSAWPSRRKEDGRLIRGNG